MNGLEIIMDIETLKIFEVIDHDQNDEIVQLDADELF